MVKSLEHGRSVTLGTTIKPGSLSLPHMQTGPSSPNSPNSASVANFFTNNVHQAHVFKDHHRGQPHNGQSNSGPNGNLGFTNTGGGRGPGG